jgi:hypothetical protein
MITAITDRLDLTVTDLKDHLKIEHAEEDAQLDRILAAAKRQADHFCQNDFEEVTAPFPDDIKVAVLKIAATLYAAREDHIKDESVEGISYTAGQIEWSAQRLLFPYKRFFAV